MKRLLALVLLPTLTGCVGFAEDAYEEGGTEWVAPAACGCRTPTISPIPAAQAAVTPTVSQMSAGQTREPDLAPAGR